VPNDSSARPARQRRPHSPGAFAIAALAVLAAAILTAATHAPPRESHDLRVWAMLLSGSFAVTVATGRLGYRAASLTAGVITTVLGYLVLVNLIDRTNAVVVATVYLGGVLVVFLGASMAARARRALEPRSSELPFDPEALRFIDEAAARGTVTICATWTNPRPAAGDREPAAEWGRSGNTDSRLTLEISVADNVADGPGPVVAGRLRDGRRTLHVEVPDVANTIAAVLLQVRDRTGQIPRVHFSWAEESPWAHLLRFLTFDCPDVTLATRELIQRAEPDPRRRPTVHVS
jgi:hypothetical protein